MSQKEGERVKITDHWRYFRLFSGKASYAPLMVNSEWYKLESIQIKNDQLFGEDMSAVVRWEHPGADALTPTPDDIAQIGERIAGGMDRENSQATLWAGRAVAEVMNLDHDDHKEQIKKLLKQLVRARKLKVETRKDKNSDTRAFYVWIKGNDGL
jgi:hypothetical protein